MRLRFSFPTTPGTRCGSGARAFTMIEVALSLAIVAFAMVAIIGVMPAGLNVQKENREDTILSQDATLLLEAIRGGSNSAALNVLANSLLSLNGPSQPVTGTNITPLEVVARLSIPRWDTTNSNNGGFNRAHFRAFSGNLGDSASAAAAVGFTYVVTTEVTNFAGDPFQPSSYNYYLTNNLYEVKLTFSWPVHDYTPGVFPTNTVGDRRLVVRTLVSGQLQSGNGGQLFQTTSYRGL